MRRTVVGLVVVAVVLIAKATGLLAFGAGEQAVPAVPESREAVTTPATALLNSTLWVQSSAEYYAAARQAYRLAELMLQQALESPDWTAALEQEAAGGFESLPPAVILDVDETVLDNSPSQARQILDDKPFNRADWHAWVREEKAEPVPGALEFTQRAARLGVKVFYVTNRRREVEDATRRNLQAWGFPLDPSIDTVYTQNERPEWGGDKGTRRSAVAAEYRILLLVGDNFGDFASGDRVSVAERAEMAHGFGSRWGRQWIVLPNPEYGSWDGALIQYRYSLPETEKIQRKMAALDARR